ncbi:ROK family protein [bacterium]
MLQKYYLGVDLGGTKIYTALADINGYILHETRIPTEAHKSRKDVLDNIYRSINICMEKTDASAHEIISLGMGVPGQINYEKGLVINTPNIPSLNNTRIRDILFKKFKVYIHIANDAQTAGLAESRYGAGKSVNNFVYITVSTGIGGGIIINNQLHRGFRGFAGEFGHTIINFAQGKNGKKILESLASGTAVKKGFGFPASLIKEKISKKEKKGTAALNNLVEFLGLGLANITVVLDPELIIIGGGVSNLGSMLLNPLKKEVQKNISSISRYPVKIVRAKLGKRSGVIGAILFAMQCSKK